ncbi:lactadherin-like isoform X2 [Biomphalaria glabrata]|uniref:Lactadherin-like isoform X2 n=1 Tax=Biomphalaria glabrata TaxID=6526 RepID=A0A9W3BM02_BIOGL|nr:lactadherin-like isoform X2 [Biomphalaria glabrata]
MFTNRLSPSEEKMANWIKGLLVLLTILLTTGRCRASVCKTNGPLGMITGAINDWQISSSSTYPNEWDNACHEKYARLYLPNKFGWCAKYKSSSEWLQVDLGVGARVTGVLTQGRGDGTEWVTRFSVSYSMDAYHWNYVTDNYNNAMVFEGNTDSFSVKHNYLDKPIMARYIKFHTIQWNRHPSMRVEIMGCQLCKEPLGLPPYGKMSASSSRKFQKGSSCQPEDGHILSSKSWCSKKQNDSQWLQIDVGPPTLITGIITKGRGDTQRNHWVQRFKIAYSNDTRVWYSYKDAVHLLPKSRWQWSPSLNTSSSHLISDQYSETGLLFGGNSDKDTPRIHFLYSPFVARYVRFQPVEWKGKISMRAGLLGCPYTGECSEGFMRVNEDTPCIENLAYKKDSWINKKLNKRHIREGHAERAVDGDLDLRLQSCTILDNLYGKYPLWTVDLGQKTTVSGVVIYTWQGDGPARSVSFRDYMRNLDQLVVYVDDKIQKKEDEHDESYASGNMCNYISSINNALFSKRLVLQCVGNLVGRYVLIEAWGRQIGWSRLFGAVLCEVQVFN